MTFPWNYPADFTDTPNRFISLWNSTSLSDPRICFEDKQVTVRQQPTDEYFKMGFLSSPGIIRYKNNGCEFVKTAVFDKNVTYPDNNVNIEIFACRYMMELETLAPLCTLKPGESCEHGEMWELKKQSDF